VNIGEWLDEVWSRADVVQVVAGGEDAGALTRRAVLAEMPSSAALRTLTTAGRFTGDICRCHGGPTIVLRDASGEALARASVHGYGSVSWERTRFRDDLEVADPAGLHLLLAEHGVPHQLASFRAPLTERLKLHEGRPQFRPAGKAGLPVLVQRAVPEVLHPMLSAGCSPRRYRRRSSGRRPCCPGSDGSPCRPRPCGVRACWCGVCSRS
jgi:hypothetical protein